MSALNDRCLLLLLLFSPPFPSLSLSCSSGVSTRILCNVDTMTDGARRKKKKKEKKKPVRIVPPGGGGGGEEGRGNNNRHLSARRNRSLSAE